MRIAPFSAFVCALVASSAVAGDIRTERVHFAKGATSATVNGTLTGYETVDYVLGAAKGQYMNVSMATPNTATYFNLLAPGENEVAFFNGSVDGNQYEGTLPATGDYKVRVYMMRSAARRNEKAPYRLEMIVTGAPARPAAAAASAPPARVDATGHVPCAQHAGQPTMECPFAVTRTGPGNATVVVTLPDGRKRTLFFVGGKATRSDASQADGASKLSTSRESDLNFVRVGEERYEIPDALVSGG